MIHVSIQPLKENPKKYYYVFGPCARRFISKKQERVNNISVISLWIRQPSVISNGQLENME